MCLKPLLDGGYTAVAREWMDECLAWEHGDHRYLQSDPDLKREYPFYWEYCGDPPDKENYRPEWPTDAVLGYAMYETVSEGTPLTPTFATPEELVDFLCTQKDGWGYGPQTRDNAQRFVSGGWAPSGLVVAGVYRSGIEAMELLSEK